MAMAEAATNSRNVCVDFTIDHLMPPNAELSRGEPRSGEPSA